MSGLPLPDTTVPGPFNNDALGDRQGLGTRLASKTLVLPTALTRTKSGTSTIVPRAARKGLLSSFTIVPEIEDPTTYSPATKRVLVFIVAAAAMSGPTSCGIMFPALPGIESDLRVSATVANLSVSVFLLGMGVSPLWLAYVSEHFGRRSVYIATFAIYTLFSLLCGFAQSIGELLAFRFIAALASGSAQALGAGTIADIYVVQERGTAMGWFYLGPLVGPIMAPIVGGALTSVSGPASWRNTQWFLTAFAGFAFVLLTFGLPETLRHPQILKIPRSANDIEDDEANSALDHASITKFRNPTRREVIMHTILDPFKTFLFLRYPAVTCSILYASTNFGLLYVMNISIEYAFSHAPYKFGTVVIGCLYLGNSIGYIIGSILGGKWCDHVLIQATATAATLAGKADAARESGGTTPSTKSYVPEKRIGINAWTGAALAPAGILLYGWTIEYGIIWIVPLIGTFFFGLGTMFIYSAVTTYLIDALPGRSSSAMALNNFIRNVLACGGSVAAVPLIDALGYGVLFSIITGVLAGSAVLVLLIVLRGDAWRAKAQQRLDAEKAMARK